MMWRMVRKRAGRGVGGGRVKDDVQKREED